LTIKQSLKFLYSFGFSLKDKVVFLIRQTEQVLGAVIILDAIKMVDNPSFWQWFSVSFFPNKNVLTNIKIGYRQEIPK